MYNFYFDSGTTNTRAYLLKDETIIAHSASVLGSRDVVLQNDKDLLVRSLYEMYRELCRENDLSDSAIKHIYLSGMVSSPMGIVEVEHITVPVGRRTLAQQIHSYYEPLCFQRELRIFPGLKTLPCGTLAQEKNVSGVNNMRGEEVELFGIMHRYPALEKGTVLIVLPGSHTQVALVRNGVVENISSNVTGELYYAIVNHTILSASVAGGEKTELIPEMVELGYQNVQTYGFNRALYIVRTMDLFSTLSLAHRRSYLEGVINAGVVTAMAKMLDGECAQIAVAGTRTQYEIFSTFSKKAFPGFKVLPISSKEQFPFSVEGLLCLIREIQE